MLVGNGLGKSAQRIINRNKGKCVTAIDEKTIKIDSDL